MNIQTKSHSAGKATTQSGKPCRIKPERDNTLAPQRAPQALLAETIFRSFNQGAERINTLAKRALSP
jgi:hypothetical protein